MNCLIGQLLVDILFTLHAHDMFYFTMIFKEIIIYEKYTAVSDLFLQQR